MHRVPVKATSTERHTRNQNATWAGEASHFNFLIGRFNFIFCPPGDCPSRKSCRVVPPPAPSRKSCRGSRVPHPPGSRVTGPCPTASLSRTRKSCHPPLPLPEVVSLLPRTLPLPLPEVVSCPSRKSCHRHETNSGKRQFEASAKSNMLYSTRSATKSFTWINSDSYEIEPSPEVGIFHFRHHWIYCYKI